MADGLVIMLIGMGVVFSFLLVLMIFIRLLGLRTAPSHSAPLAASDRSPAGAPQALVAGAPDEAIARAAAIAVAIELAQRPARAGASLRTQAAAGSAWRADGRVQLHQGPQTVGAVLASRRSAR